MIGIFDELREANNGEEVSNEIKDKLLSEIDTPMNEEGYYLDAFENPISFNGIRKLKKPYTKLNINQHQKKEIIVCQNDYYYFRRNYCKIVSKKGIQRPEPREYQARLEHQLVSGDDVIAFWPRQCIDKDSLVNINGEDKSIIDLFSETKEEGIDNIYLNPEKDWVAMEPDAKFIESYKTNNKYINSLKGPIKILEVHKTVLLNKFKIILDNGYELEGASNHIVMDENFEEIQIKKSIGKKLITDKGLSKVIEVIDMNIKENMYDLTLDDEDELYFSNGILSHNSGKSVTVSTYLLWKAITTPNINIGIAANVQKLATEVLDKIKKIYIELPIWLQPGLLSWNKQSVEFDNGTKIITSATNGDSFRGFSLHILYADEVAFIRSNIWEDFADAVFPAQEALAEKQTICSSTAKGINHWYNMVEGARKPKYLNLSGDDEIKLKDGSIVSIEEYYKENKILNKN